jgi:three-Cys-motif partner protein
LSVQCVGPQAKDKHDYVRRYIDATWGARRKFFGLGAAYIDLFAGPGRARIRTNGAIIDGTPLIALRHDQAPFSRVLLCDVDPENVAALRERTKTFEDRVRIIEGDCNERIDEIMKLIPPGGLNFAFIDPFNLNAIEKPTLLALASVKKMDLLIHFSTMDFKRNVRMGSPERAARAFGGQPGAVTKPGDFVKVMQGFSKCARVVRVHRRAGEIGRDRKHQRSHSLSPDVRLQEHPW